LQLTCREGILSLWHLMKYFTSILAIYITALAIVPCSDGNIVGCSTDFNKEHIELKDHIDHSHDHEDDDCTPFCTCICCGSLISMPITNIFFLGRIDLLSIYRFDYSFNYSLDYSNTVWHPPTFC